MYMEGMRRWESKGAVHAFLVHILWVEDNPRTVVLVLHMQLLYVCALRSTVEQPHVHACYIPQGVGYGWQ